MYNRKSVAFPIGLLVNLELQGFSFGGSVACWLTVVFFTNMIGVQTLFVLMMLMVLEENKEEAAMRNEKCGPKMGVAGSYVPR